MAGVSTKEIKNRIRSMESTKQITKAMEMVAASKLRRAQAQVLNSRPYFEILHATIQDIVRDTKARLALGERIVAVLKQKNNAPKEVAQQVCIIYAVTNGYLNSIPVEKIPEFEKQLEEHMENRHYHVLDAIRTTGKLEAETENNLKTALNELVERFA